MSFYFKKLKGIRLLSFLCYYWHRSFGLMDTPGLGFKAKVDFSFLCLVACAIFMYDTCRLLTTTYFFMHW